MSGQNLNRCCSNDPADVRDDVGFQQGRAKKERETQGLGERESGASLCCWFLPYQRQSPGDTVD